MSEKELQLMYSYESLDYDIPTVRAAKLARKAAS